LAGGVGLLARLRLLLGRALLLGLLLLGALGGLLAGLGLGRRALAGGGLVAPLRERRRCQSEQKAA
jgi:hypothetical protein